MILSDAAVRRPVLATVASLLLLTFGAISFLQLPLRELPDIDAPVVSIDTRYQISGIEGIKTIDAVSQDGRSSITIEFDIERDIDAAANDLRDAVARVAGDLPLEADPPEIFKANADERPVVWFNLNSTILSPLELTDYAERHLVDRLSTIDGVARVRFGGKRRYAMRIWLDRVALAARSLTVADVERALRNENISSPRIATSRSGWLGATPRPRTSRSWWWQGARMGTSCGSARWPGSSWEPRTTAASSGATASLSSRSGS